MPGRVPQDPSVGPFPRASSDGAAPRPRDVRRRRRAGAPRPAPRHLRADGLLLLVGLAAKNAILLVSFARDLRDEGEDAVAAAKGAVRLRMRPILMTSFAFILGSVPLAVASGASANARISMGTVVIGGLLVATLLTLFVTPVFYVAAERLAGRRTREAAPGRGGAPQPAE